MLDQPENGTLNMEAVDVLHAHLLSESPLYREAYIMGWVGLMATLQLRELEGQPCSR